MDHVDESRTEALRQIRYGAVRTHAAGVRPCVAVPQSLVVTCRRKRQRGAAVADGDETGFLARKTLLQNNNRLRRFRGRRRGTVRDAGEQRSKRGLGRGEVVADRHALAGCEAVGLYHQPV